MLKFSIDRSPRVHDEAGKPWYDTKKGVTEAVKTLRGFNDLLTERHTAGYTRDERMNEFFVLGRYLLDTCGNCSKAHGSIPKELMPNIPDVLEPAEFQAYTQEHTGKGNTFFWDMDGNGNLPIPGLLCFHCKKPWDNNNFHDTIVRHDTMIYPPVEFIGESLAMLKFVYEKRNDAVYRTEPDILIRNDRNIDSSPKYPNPQNDWQEGIVKNERGWLSRKDGIGGDYIIQEGDEVFLNVWRYFHSACNREYLLQQMGPRFRTLFVKAGFKMVSMMDISNEYSSSEFYPPWFSVITEIGTIKIGWRKWVINIDWGDLSTKKQGIPRLFEVEQVTKWKDGIHASGWQKAEEYLRRIREHFAT